MESTTGSAASVADLNPPAWNPSWAPTEITLLPGASREDRAIAERLLAAYLAPFCERLIGRLGQQREFMRCCALSHPIAEDAREVLEAETADLRRVLRRAKRIRNDPRNHARRELRRMVAMLGSVPLEKLVVAESELTVFLKSFAREGPAEGRVDFEVHLPSPDHQLAPVFIRPANTGRGSVVFIRGGCHGACRGEAEPLVASCAERVDLAGLLLTALAWARRNIS